MLAAVLVCRFSQILFVSLQCCTIPTIHLTLISEIKFQPAPLDRQFDASPWRWREEPFRDHWKAKWKVLLLLQTVLRWCRKMHKVVVEIAGSLQRLIETQELLAVISVQKFRTKMKNKAARDLRSVLRKTLFLFKTVLQFRLKMKNKVVLEVNESHQRLIASQEILFVN